MCGTSFWFHEEVSHFFRTFQEIFVKLFYALTRIFALYNPNAMSQLTKTKNTA